MQVSQSNDFISHAVVGQQESVAMGISQDAALMHILSSSLYTFPMLAAVREVICNGWDGHIMADKLTTPLVITLTDNLFSVRDFGPGIAHENIGPIYGVYGKSTKEDDPTQTGGFGFGSKAPFAYTDNFEVISCHEGTKTIYRVSKSSMEKMGKPTINKIVSMPTEETGITVSYAIQPHHRNEFTKIINEVLLLGGIPAILNDKEPIEPLPLLESPTGYIISSVAGTLIGRINVRYGNVVYPIPRHPAFEAEWVHVMSAMNRLWGSANIIFMAQPDSVSIAPSREALNFTEETIATLKKLLGQFSPKDTKDCEKAVAEKVNYMVNQQIEKAAPVTSSVDLYAAMNIEATEFKAAHHPSGPYAYTIRQARLNHLMQQTDLMRSGAHLYMKRFESAIRRKAYPDQKFAKAMRKAIYKQRKITRHSEYSGMKAVIHKYLTLPLYEYIAAHPKMDKDRLFYSENVHHFGASALSKVRQANLAHITSTLSFLNKKALVVRSKKAAHEFLWGSQKDHGNGYVVYIAQGHPDRIQEAVDMFKTLGYTVDVDIPEKQERLKLEPTERLSSPKRKGYLTLAQSWNGRKWLLNTARQNGSLAGLKDPIAWVELDNQSSPSEGKFFAHLTTEECQIITQLWGDQIAVVAGLQLPAMHERGIPSVKDFILAHVDKTLVTRPDFPRYLAFARQMEHSKNFAGYKEILRSMLHHEDLMKDLGIRFSLSAETEMLLTFYKNKTPTQLPLCAALSGKVKSSSLPTELYKKIDESPWRRFLELDHLINALQVLQPNTPETAVPYEILRKLLK